LVSSRLCRLENPAITNSDEVIPPDEPIWEFPKQKARDDMPNYTLVDKVVFRYGDLPF